VHDKGFAFVQFERAQAAQEAIACEHNRNFFGKSIVVKKSMPTNSSDHHGGMRGDRSRSPIHGRGGGDTAQPCVHRRRLP